MDRPVKSMWLTIIIFCITVFGANSLGYEAYGGGSYDGYSDAGTKVPALPIEPPRLNVADADLLRQSAGYGAAAVQSKAATIGIMAASGSDDNSNSAGLGPSLGYRPPPPPTRREVESHGQCSFDASKWTHEPENAISQAIMFDRTTDLSCEKCLKKCSDEYQNYSVPWVCRSLTYDHQWNICDLFAVNGTESPYHLTEFHGRDYFVYLAALQPTDEQLTAVSKSKEESKEYKSENANDYTTPSNVTPKPSCSSASFSSNGESSLAKKSSEDHPPGTNIPVQIEITEPIEAATQPTKIISALVEQQHEVTASNIANEYDAPASRESVSSFVTEAPAVVQTADATSGSSSSSVSKSILESDSKSEANSIASVASSNAEFISGVPSASDDSSAKSYASKTQQLTEIKITPETVVERSFETEIAPAQPAPQLSDFQSTLENFESENVRQQNEISGSTENEQRLLNELSAPKIIKLGEKTTTTTLIRTTGIAPAPTAEFLKESLRSSIHSLGERAEIGVETNDTISFIQERIESSSSSASASAATSASSSTSTETKSVSSSLSHSQQPLSIVSHSTNTESSKSYGQKTAEKIQNDVQKMSSCDDNSLSRFMSFDGFERADNVTVKSFPLARSVEECVDACDSQRLKACSSIAYSDARGCELHTSAVDHHTAGVLKTAPGLLYVEKFCIPTKKAQSIRKISPVVPNHILVGHVQEVANAKSFVDCQISCLNADLEHGFTCKSAMWYPLDNDQNCLLNAESRHTQPEVFVTEDPGVVMHYFELVPENTASVLKIKAIQQMMRFRDLPLQVERRILRKSIKKSDANSKWTHWSACKADETNTIRVRYMKCSEHKDIRKCPKETSACINEKAKISEEFKNVKKGICLAVRDAIGRKHCSYGMRTKENGQREFCVKPVDCA